MPRKSALCCSLVNVNLVIELDLFSSVLLAAATDSSSLSLHVNGSSFCVDVEAFWSSFFKNPHTGVFSTCLYSILMLLSLCMTLQSWLSHIRENDLMHNLHFALMLFEGSGNSQSLYSTLSIHSLLNLIAMMSLNC